MKTSGGSGARKGGAASGGDRSMAIAKDLSASGARIAAASAVVLALAFGAAHVACDDIPPDPPPPPRSRVTPDHAGEVETETDADASAPTTVTVTVMRSTGSAADVLVAMHDEEGEVLEVARTGPDGSCALITHGSQVSVFLVSQAVHAIVTYVGVEVGDALVVRDTSGVAGAVATVTSSQGNFPNTVAGYEATVASCAESGATIPISVPLQNACIGSTMSALLRAFSLGATTAYSFQKNVEVDASAALFPMSTGAWLVPARISLQTKNLPSGALLSTGLVHVVGETGFRAPGDGTPGDGGVSKYDIAPSFADALQARVSASRIVDGRRMTRTVLERFESSEAPSVDFAGALPEIVSVTVGSEDIVRPSIEWATEAPPAKTSGGFASLGYANGAALHWWSFVVAPDTTKVVAPKLPAEAQEWAPSDGANGTPRASFVLSRVQIVEAEHLGDYAKLRALPLVPAAVGGVASASSMILPAKGRATTSESSSEEL